MSTKKIQLVGSILTTDTTLSQLGVAADAKIVGDALAEKQPIGDYALKSEIPAVPVQSVNGKTGAVNLTPSDIGAQVAGNYLTEESDPTVPAWAKAETKPSYTAAEVDADPVGTASAAVSTHNTATDAHNDIRLLIEGLTTRLNTLADSDDTTLDQMSEIVAYIKSNKTLIENVTTNKVNVSDIIDNLTTNVTNKPLSAAQGVVLKGLIDALDSNKLDVAHNTATDAHSDIRAAIPTTTSQLTNDSGYLTAVPDEYVTDTELTAKGYLTQAQMEAYVNESIIGGEW